MEERSEVLVQRLNESLDSLNQLREEFAGFLQRTEEASPEEVAGVAREYSSRLDERLGVLEANLKEAADLSEELVVEPPPAVKPYDLAQPFRSMIETIQNQAREPQEGDVAATLKAVDVELKGLIVVEEDETRVVTPRISQAVDPAMLSTIRMSFGSIPVLRGAQTRPE